MATNLKSTNPADYIQPLLMNGLEGRMLFMPAPRGKTRNILFVYGFHASLERQFGITQLLNTYGSVTVPDLPGFGGMQSFYKIGLKPSLDNQADYLAAFVKLRYRNKKVTIVALSLGFAIATRMLQRCPELAKKVNLLVSVVGFAHHEEFTFKRSNYLLMRYGASFFSNRLPAFVAQKLILRPVLIRATYRLMQSRNPKLAGADREERDKRIDFEVELWRTNDLRTYMDIAVSMLRLNLIHEKVDLPLYHVNVSNDRYFDNHVVEQHLSIIYSKVTVIPAKYKHHSATMITDVTEASDLIPYRLKRLLAQKPS